MASSTKVIRLYPILIDTLDPSLTSSKPKSASSRWSSLSGEVSPTDGSFNSFFRELQAKAAAIIAKPRNKKLGIPGDSTKLELPGLKVKEPAFGVDAYWIDPHMQADAEAKGYVIVEPDEVLVTHLSQILNGYSADLLGQEEVQELLNNLKISYPNLVETVVPKIVPLNQLTSIMKLILDEGVPISDLRLILESLSAINLQKMDNDDIAETIRPKLVPLLIQKLSKFKDTLPLITFAPDLEQLILTTVRQNPDEKMLLLEGNLAKKILANLNEASEDFNKEGKPVFLIVAPQIRRHVAKFVRSQLPSINILSFTELPEDRNVEIAFTVGGFDAIE